MWTGESTRERQRCEAIWLMKERDRLRRVFEAKEGTVCYPGMCYDGKYVWAPVVGREPLVLVIDPESERIVKVTANDGLPPMGRGAAAAPLAPGRACVAGCFRGKHTPLPFDRSWCAIVELTPAGAKSVDVFHEARSQAIGRSEDDYRNSQLAFRPILMATLTDENDGSRRRVLLRRHTRARSVRHHPLLIDPETRSVTVIEGTISLPDIPNVTCHKGAVYWTFHNYPAEPEWDWRLWRIGFPDFRRTAVAGRAPGERFLLWGKVVFCGDRIHVVGDHWWTAKNLDEGFKRLRAKMPVRWSERSRPGVFRSRHYGLLLVTLREGVFKVEFPEALKSERSRE